MQGTLIDGWNRVILKDYKMNNDSNLNKWLLFLLKNKNKH